MTSGAGHAAKPSWARSEDRRPREDATLLDAMSDDAPKTAFELAMERLRQKEGGAGAEERPLTDAQKADIAEHEILHRDALARAGSDEEVARLGEELRRVRRGGPVKRRPRDHRDSLERRVHRVGDPPRLRGQRDLAALVRGPPGGEGSGGVATADGGLLVAGVTESFGAGQGEAWLLRLDADGDIVWQTAVGGPAFDSASDVKLTRGRDRIPSIEVSGRSRWRRPSTR